VNAKAEVLKAMTQLRGILVCTVAAAGLLCGGQASAALLQIGSGTSFTSPTSNNVLGSGVSLVKGATLDAESVSVFFCNPGKAKVGGDGVGAAEGLGDDDFGADGQMHLVPTGDLDGIDVAFEFEGGVH
jgi:hypothetical protein